MASIIHDSCASSIVIDGLVTAPMAFTPLSEEVPADYLKTCGESGLRLFFFVCDLPWLGQPGLDVNSLRRRLTELQESVPGAKVILRVNLHPPLRWMEENPDALVRLMDGTLLRNNFLSCYYPHENEDIPVYSLVSQAWRNEAGEELKKLMVAVEDMPDGDSVAGYFMAAGATGEWFYLGMGEGIDHGLAFREHFAGWLRRKYKTPEALQHAWRMDHIDFSDFPLPSLIQKSGHYSFQQRWTRYRDCPSHDDSIKQGTNPYALGGFINPETSFSAIDFFLSLHQGVAESIEYFCRIVKEQSKGQLLTGAFHGAVDQAGIRKVLLPSASVDILATPGIYINRKPGEITDIRCMSESFDLHNKLFFMEDDTRTHLASSIIRETYKTFTSEESLTQMKRDFGRNLCRNLYGWWFDMFIPPNSVMSRYSQSSLAHGGSWWYNSPAIMGLIKQQQRISVEARSCDRSRLSSIAVIMDESSTAFGSHHYGQNAVYWRSSELSRIGVPVDFYYQDDLDHPSMRDYKLYVFVNVFMLNDADRRRIRNKVCRNHSPVLWMYGSGVCNPDAHQRFSPVHIKDLTGIQMRHDASLIETRFDIEDPDCDAIKGCDPNIPQGRLFRSIQPNPGIELADTGSSNEQMPNFYPMDDDAVVIGRFSIHGEPALVYRDFPDWRSMYCATQFIGSDLLRAISKNAGCHIVCDTDDFIFVNHSYVSIHAATKGLKTLRFPRLVSPRDIYSGIGCGEKVSEFAISMELGETRTFSL